ncbi:MAG: sodium-dependent bicarbonate transport family permease [Candidatus Jettenia sp.]|uniref:Sodium-dependent bicarbonate transporter n=1 Tax=Candidatus Jettenia caeni TaxID=247490 RepID=I3IL84_9BACT|nr:sodium-dependent bicarbonate transport family permease [Candidatus Jettenia sp. AMX1]MBC6927625.1 sodium-dependent bicarbonate transport family permease [Candidatus Jettenia sp.]WKZ14319.1 MAG: sodium-dependent bicarbonate transport family permease [Candidatus Jettenia caeni]KAA0250103.1 MAG: sodium-dependent bicarbonate transport family permease [Candidatus Jettenia sp. AMX1]MCE7880186.1 sodium-dependent bicarbonate transport family permease [Candidatus Jettenia sp. AMX1]MCQ3926626.1 sodiu
MDIGLIINNLVHPPVLFFFLGMIASFCKSDLKIPDPLPKLFSLYLLLAIGFHGGVELRKTGINQEVIFSLSAGILMAIIVPIYTFFILKIKLDTYNAAAIAATYGSISAVTFITAVTFLQTLGLEPGGYMVAALALMESPAIVIGIILARLFAPNNKEGNHFSWGMVMKEAFLNGSVLLISGSLLIGLASGEEGWDTLKPFTKDIFKGMLSFFLLDMGLLAAKRIGDLKSAGFFLPPFAILVPVLNACVAIFIAKLIHLQPENALVFSVLCASASYIAVPAAMRLSLPEANPSLFVPMALAITFPFNIIVGIPLYYYLIMRTDQWIPLFWK